MQIQLAKSTDLDEIWTILQQAILRRKEEGSTQWQDGYPNPDVIKKDISKQAGFVLKKENFIIGYFTVFVNDEPEYNNIDGKWLTNDDFLVIHRVAIADGYLGLGYAKKIFQFIEVFAKQKNIHSIKVDTNFDNIAMLKTFASLDYTYCGQVYFRGTPRRAYEKILKEENWR